MAIYKVIAGVDDAGRGPVIGPLIIAGVGFIETEVHLLQKWGVRDSKGLTPRKRRELFTLIKRISHKISIKVIDVSVIDSAVFRRNYKGLNHLEAVYTAMVISEIVPNVVYVDSPDVIPNRFKDLIIENLPSELKCIRVICENKADEKYIVVAAASIVAKETRERIIKSLKLKYGDFGSGYPSDPRTIEFLRRYYLSHGEFPPIVRTSWSTLDRILKLER